MASTPERYNRLKRYPDYHERSLAYNQHWRIQQYIKHARQRIADWQRKQHQLRRRIDELSKSLQSKGIVRKAA